MANILREAAKSLYPRRESPSQGRRPRPRKLRLKAPAAQSQKDSSSPLPASPSPEVPLSNQDRHRSLIGERPNPIYVDFDPAQAPVGPSGFKGQKLSSNHGYDANASLQDLVDLGFEVVPWDGCTYRPIIDKKTRLVLGALAGRPSPPSGWDASVGRMNSILEAERKSMEALLPPGSGQSTRGAFIALNGGYSYGGGRRQPTACMNSDLPEPIVGPAIRRIVSDGDFDELATYISNAFRRTAPGMYHHYQWMAEAVESKINSLKRPFVRSVYPTFTVNFGPRVATIPHRDSENLPWAFCGIAALGRFDPSKGGHIVLWELKLVVEFPPGSTVLIPSALITHSNLPIHNTGDERRYSFTQYAAGDLFRWVENGFRTHKSLFSSPGQLAKLDQRKVEDHYARMRYGAKLKRMLPVMFRRSVNLS